ncbi:hypothetical protein [Gorillibacterium sp. CAU 1737]|uniref:hypothetical protein n=1 Tax=Gorillibacterium sp. CAU 1737 TaxID=3140362 RepID=UPI003261BC11
MNPFPKEHELIGLFESEPRVLDEATPWFYNSLFFTLIRDQDRLECSLEPAHGVLSLTLKTGDRILYELTFENIIGMEIERGTGKEQATFLFSDEDTMKTLLLETRPAICLRTTNDNSFRK